MLRAIVLHPDDNVATLIDAGRASQSVQLSGEIAGQLELRADVPFGHKCATRAISKGAAIRKYGQIVGRATAPIGIGDHVHVHNVEALRGRGDISESR
ncbi:UxaA family hydrolase [Leptospira interrogans]